MNVRWLTTAVMLTVFIGLVRSVPAGDADAAVARDLKLMAGNWRLHSFMTDGKEVPADKLKNIKLTIQGNEYFVDFGKEKMKLTFKLDPTRKPKQIDLVNSKKVLTPGIYEVSADTLKLCRGTRTGQERPTEFTAKEGTGFVIAVYHRDKK